MEGQVATNFAGASWDRFVELISSPIQFPDMLWILVPLLLTLFLMELYFTRYQFEELGWNTAFGNTLVLIFVSLDLFRHLSNSNELVFGLKVMLVGAIVLLGVVLTLFNFFHILPKELGFAISSKFPMNFLALCGVLVIYSRAPIDWVTFAAIIILMVVVYSFIRLLGLMVPKDNQEVADI